MSGVRVSAQALVVAASALAVSASAVQAGGLSVHEQSASAQGSSFAGSAAGYDLSSGFWNPAAYGIAGWGLTTESNYTLIIPNSDVSGTAGVGGAPSTSIHRRNQSAELRSQTSDFCASALWRLHQ